MNGFFGEPLAGLHGNDDIKLHIFDAYKRGALSHAYIFEGRRGSGRHTLAREIAKLLEPDFARKIDGDLTPDVIFIHCEENKKSIGVDTIRAVKEQAFLTPNEMDCMIFIIEDAELMTSAAQNAFLKLLEEPPRDTYYFLICESTNGLLPTVISRAPMLRTEVFSDDEISHYLLENNKKAADLLKKDPEAFGCAIRSASGSIGEAIRLLDARARGSADSVSANAAVKSSLELLSATDKAGFYALIVSLTAKREEFAVFLSYFEAALRDMLTAKSGADECRPSFFAEYRDAEQYSYKYTIGAIHGMIAAVTETHEAVFGNVNIRLAETVFADRVWKAVTNGR